MPPITKADIELPTLSGIAADSTHLSLYFDRGTAPDATDYDHLRTDLGLFFSGTGTGQTNPVSHYLSKSLNGTSGIPSVRFYTVPAVRGPLGAPVATRLMTIGAVDTGSPLPSEVAVCLSYQRTYGSDVEFGSHVRPRARDRGRIYLGPLGSVALDDIGTSHESRVWATMRTDLVNAAKNYLSAAALAHDWTWVQFSPTAWTWDAVTRVWVDDSFDTQRRRGLKPSTRTSLVL